jgi:hypothetical protein
MYTCQVENLKKKLLDISRNTDVDPEDVALLAAVTVGFIEVSGFSITPNCTILDKNCEKKLSRLDNKLKKQNYSEI